MEYSLFNIEIENTDAKGGSELVLFNTHTSALIVLKGKARESYEQLSGPHLDDLRRGGFVVDSQTDQIDLLRNCFECTQKDPSKLEIMLVPTYRCNLQCPYCYESEGAKPQGIMSEDVLQATYTFVENRYETHPFEKLNILWYGGEPTLCMDVISSVSARLQDFCQRNKVEYDSSIVTNTSLIDKDAARTLKRCGISHAMPTVDGLAERNDKRRVDASGKGTFDRIMQGIDNLIEQEIQVGVNLNLDRRSVEDYRALRDLFAKKGVSIYPTPINDYNRTFGKGSFTKEEFDLFSRKDYCDTLFQLFSETNYSAETLKEMLLPLPNFCRGHMDSYFIIDVLGDVYKCDGWVGNKERSCFNLFDDNADESDACASYNPTNDEECIRCRVLPLCKGQCTWNREVLDEACHPFKHTIEKYVAAYRNCFESTSEDLTFLADPIADVAQFLDPSKRNSSPGNSLYAGVTTNSNDE